MYFNNVFCFIHSAQASIWIVALTSDHQNYNLSSVNQKQQIAISEITVAECGLLIANAWILMLWDKGSLKSSLNPAACCKWNLQLQTVAEAEAESRRVESCLQ